MEGQVVRKEILRGKNRGEARREVYWKREAGRASKENKKRESVASKGRKIVDLAELRLILECSNLSLL